MRLLYKRCNKTLLGLGKHDWGAWGDAIKSGSCFWIFRAVCQRCYVPRLMGVFDNGSAKESMIFEATQRHPGKGMRQAGTDKKNEHSDRRVYF
jgi:hypothetical protein